VVSGEGAPVAIERSKAQRSPLNLDAELLNACVSCGLCLPHCPTYRATEEESASPRGRITMMRAVESGQLAIDDDFVTYMERCVMCRGCETACPSGVHFGPLMEQTRTALAEQGRLRPPAWLSPSLKMLEHHRLLLLGSSLLGIAQRARLMPDRLRKRFGLPQQIPIRRERLGAATATDNPEVWLYTGCVMDVWQRDVHAATVRVLQASGVERVGLPRTGGGCCGALHAHAGQHGDAVRLATSVMRSMPGTAAVLVNSAGCGAAMKDYGHLLGTPESMAFSARVFDVHEWLATRMDLLPSSSGPRPIVAIQDPCHLRHVQRAHLAVRTVLGPYVDIREIGDDGRCCGAGGSYSVTQPELAQEIRRQKLAAITKTGASIVASANPGCSMWLADAQVQGADGQLIEVVHPMTLVDRALRSTR
jgi:glycolate oxidase iron-sulfur subunit